MLCDYYNSTEFFHLDILSGYETRNMDICILINFTDDGRPIY